MTKYDYLEQIKSDIRDYIADNIDCDDYRGERDELQNKLNDDLWICDSVTGNASGSYYCNAYKASDAISGALDTLIDALHDFGGDPDSYKRALRDPEFADVTIRCYLLGQAIDEVLDEIEDTGVLDAIDIDEDEDTEPETMTA